MHADMVHGDYCLTSPVVDVANLPTVWLTYWRSFSNPSLDLITTVQVYDGNGWVVVENIDGTCFNSGNWTEFGVDVTNHKNPNFQVRFCYRTPLNIGYVDAAGGWNLADVTVGPAECTPP